MSTSEHIHVDDGPGDGGVAGPRRHPLSRAAGGLIVGAVWVYRFTLSPVLGGRCRFDPTCSQYMIDAVHRHGAIRGGWRGVKRVCKCHPWHPGGDDPA